MAKLQILHNLPVLPRIAKLVREIRARNIDVKIGHFPGMEERSYPLPAALFVGATTIHEYGWTAVKMLLKDIASGKVS